MSAPRSRPAVIFLHGRGLGPETAALITAAFPAVELLAPTGGVALRRGHTWFENERIGVARPESVASAEARLIAWLEAHPLGSRPIWLCGFSNGGAFAAHLMLRHPARFAGAALLSAPLVLPPWPTGGLKGKPVFYGHGDDQDTIVSADFYAAAEDYLLGPSGSLPTIHRYAAGHAIVPDMVADLGRWFQDITPAAEGVGGTK